MVIATSSTSTSIDNIRAGLGTELDSGVHRPIAEWQGTYAAIKQETKALARLANVYGKTEHAMVMAQGKRDKGQQAGMQDTKLSKLQDKAATRTTAYEVRVGLGGAICHMSVPLHTFSVDTHTQPTHNSVSHRLPRLHTNQQPLRW